MTGDVVVEVRRPPDYALVRRVPVARLLREFVEGVFRQPMPTANIVFNLVAVDDRDPLPGHPTMVNLRGGYGYGEITVVEDGTVVYQHPHTVNEVVGGPLQRWLAREYPDDERWGYGLVGAGLERLTLEHPVPRVEGGVGIRSDGRRRRAAHMEPIPDAAPEPTTLAALGVVDPRPPLGGPADPDPHIPAAVMFSEVAYSALSQRVFSHEVEEGGFLIGHRHADGDNLGRDLLEVTAVVRAESTGASLLRFTFTGESFLQLANLLARRGEGEEVLGWYHTHLFAATSEFGLSSVDVRLHSSTFRRPWQVAVLVNLGHGPRTLRCFGSVGGSPDAGLLEVPYWTVGHVEQGARAASAAQELAVSTSEAFRTAPTVVILRVLRAEP